MYELDQQYIQKLEEIATQIQESDELKNYLENEEEEDFARLKEMFEPKISQVYEEVAAQDPLQLVAFESVLLDQLFEGLYLPRILGFSVLRGELNDRTKYSRPQEHFKDVLFAICNSANFDILKKRIGQTIQIGFALSSDIWVTNLINEVTNKRIRYFLQGQKLDKYRNSKERIIGYNRYKRQFVNENFHTAEFPTDKSGLKVLFPALRSFLIHRIEHKGQNDSIMPSLNAFLDNKAFHGTNEYIQVLSLYSNFFELDKENMAKVASHLNRMRKDYPNYSEEYLTFLLEMHNHPGIDLNPEADKQASEVVNRKIKDTVASYYTLLDIVHEKGYISDEAQSAVKEFYNQHPGRSIVNNCIRATIFSYFHRLITNLEPREYPELFEISKFFAVYMDIFANQKFNQDLKVICMAYVRKLLKKYTDKRGKDYQDIKKFVSSNFPDFGFLKEKEVVELFKTRRKKKPASA